MPNSNSNDSKLICSKCKDKDKSCFSSKQELEKHEWVCHPSDMYQKSWSKHYQDGTLRKFNLGYQDDPYY